MGDRRRLLLLHRERKDRRVLLVPHHSHLKWGVTRGCRDRPNGVSGKVKDHLLHPEWLHLLFLVLIRWVQSHHHREVLHRCQVSHHLATIHGVSSSNSNRRTITAVAVVVEAEVEAEVEVVVPGHKVPVPINGPDIKITDHQGHGWVDTIPDGWDTVDRRRLLLLHRERK